MATTTEIKQSIQFMKNWENTDLRELQDDRSSDYALWILENHKHIDTALEVMKTELEKWAYTE